MQQSVFWENNDCRREQIQRSSWGNCETSGDFSCEILDSIILAKEESKASNAIPNEQYDDFGIIPLALVLSGQKDKHAEKKARR